MFGLSPEAIAQGGIIIIALIIFFESGVMVGFFLPGDTLQVTAGIFAAQGQLHISSVIIAIFFAAVAGDNIGYMIGRTSGRRLFRKPDGIVFRQEYIQKSEYFYQKYGTSILLVARIVPIVRSFVPITAGISRMPRAKFIFFNALGIAIWATTLPLLGYFVGSRIPNIGHIMEYLVMAVVIASLLPTAIHILRRPKSRLLAAKALRKLLGLKPRRYRRKAIPAADKGPELSKSK